MIGLIAEALNDNDLAHDMRERAIRPRITAFQERLRKVQAQGQLPADADLDVALDLIYGPINWISEESWPFRAGRNRVTDRDVSAL